MDAADKAPISRARYGGLSPRSRAVGWLPGDNVVGAAVPIELVVHHDEESAIVVDGICCYPNGFAFTVTAHLRAGYNMSDLPGPEVDSPQAVRVGVMLSDDRAVFSDADGPATDTGDGDPILSARGFRGGRWSMARDYFVWPLPPPGPVTVLLAWPSQGIDDLRAEVDAADLRTAAGRSVTLWPEVSPT